MMQNTEHTAAPLLVRGGRVHDAVHPEPQQIDLLLENGRIAESGRGCCQESPFQCGKRLEQSDGNNNVLF